jgi:hypothetical protein
MDKSECKGCKKPFKTSTLEKNSGNCGRCCKKDTNININLTQSQQTFSQMMLPVPQMMFVQAPIQQQPQPKGKKLVVPKDSSKKNPIPQKLRQQVWETNVGDKFWGNCFVCQMRIHALEFSCGHIISEFKGGKMVLENMKVVCKSCNSKMGIQNMLEFKEQRYSTTVQQPIATNLLF